MNLVMTLKQHKMAALKHARELIKSDYEEYICYALENYFENDSRCRGRCRHNDKHPKAKAANYLTQYIAKSLGCTINKHTGLYYRDKCLEDYFIKQGYGVRYSDFDCGKMKQVRLSYIDWMLSCYEENK